MNASDISKFLEDLFEACDRLSPYLRHEHNCHFYLRRQESECDCGLPEKWKIYEKLKAFVPATTEHELVEGVPLLSFPSILWHKYLMAVAALKCEVEGHDALVAMDDRMMCPRCGEEIKC